MKAKDAELVEEIKAGLLDELSEWLGFDIPGEGTDDYQTWQKRLKGIKRIRTMDDVLVYAAEFVADEDAFFEKWGLSD